MPSLPRAAQSNTGTRLNLGDLPLELLTWVLVIEGPQEEIVENELGKGRFHIPADCPIEPSVLLEGVPFAAALVSEKHSRVVCDGMGALWSSGFVLKDGAKRIVDCLCDLEGGRGESRSVLILVPRRERYSSQNDSHGIAKLCVSLQTTNT
jgi:hypothetical protein